MYLLLILLVSPAFGRPSSDQPDVGGGIINQLDSIVSFNNETGNLLDNSNLTEKVVESLLVAEQHLLEMEVELKTLKYYFPELHIEGEHFSAFIKAKSFVRMTRQELREFAYRNVAGVRDLKILLEEVDESNDPVLFKISIDKMKDLMSETVETLKEAREKYNSAVETFGEVITSIRTQNIQLKKMLTKDSAWVDWVDWVIKVTKVAREGCVNETDKGFLGLEALEDKITNEQNCSATIEAEIAKTEAELEKLKTITDKMLESGNHFEKTIQEAMKIINYKTDLIRVNTENVENVSKEIENYPDEFMRKYQAIRTIFINGLDDLKNDAEKFLAQPKDFTGSKRNSQT